MQIPTDAIAFLNDEELKQNMDHQQFGKKVHFNVLGHHPFLFGPSCIRGEA